MGQETRLWKGAALGHMPAGRYGKSLDEIRAGMQNVAEGVDTTAAAVRLAERLGVEMPITAATYDVLFNGTSIQQAVADLLGRAPSPEVRAT